MKRLGILRHAKSDWSDLTLRDFDRGLNKRGRKGAALIGRHIARRAPHWDKAVASPARRVVETLEQAGLDLPVAWRDEAYLAPAETLIDILRETGGAAGKLLLAGHNPGLQELIFRLVDPAQDNVLLDEIARKFPTAAYAEIELDIAEWADLSTGKGRLVHFIRPRDLDPRLGPQG